MSLTHSAYLGSQDLKKQTLQRAKERVQQGNIVASRKPSLDAESGVGSPFAVLLQSTDYTASDSTLGIPTDTVALYETVLSSFIVDKIDGDRHSASTPEQATTSFLQWLEAIPSGADLSDTPRRFVALLLSKLASNPPSLFTALPTHLKDLLARLSHLYGEREATPAQWREVRRQAVQLTDASEGNTALLSQFAETVAWPAEEAPEEILSAVSRLVSGVRWSASQSVFTAEELAGQQKVQEAIERFAKAGNTLTEESISQLPELKAYEELTPSTRRSESLDRGNEAGLQLGEFLHELLVRVTIV